jgi:hypothetical protein
MSNSSPYRPVSDLPKFRTWINIMIAGAAASDQSRKINLPDRI